MRLLAIDTAANLCAACVLDTLSGAELGRVVEDIGTGHAERLMDVLGQTLEQAGCAYSDLDRIAVVTGPGSFTGVRVGVSAARGLALALRCSCVGVTTLEGLAAEARAQHPGLPVLAAIDARRGEAYTALYDAQGVRQGEPAVLSVEAAARLASADKPVLTGSAAEALAAMAAGPFEFGPLTATADIATYANLAASMQPSGSPKPFYLRDPDAKPQAVIIPRSSG